MSEQKEIIFVEGEKRPPCKPSDAYLMAVLWFGDPGTRDGTIEFLCDSHYGLRRFRQVFENVACGNAKKSFTIQFLIQPELTAFVESVSHEDCIPTLASRLDIYPSDDPEMFSLEYAGNNVLELYVGRNGAQDFRVRLDRFEDVWDGDREIYIPDLPQLVAPPSKKSNSLAACFFVTAVWPGLHKSPLRALRYRLYQLYLKYPPGVNDTAQDNRKSPD